MIHQTLRTSCFQPSKQGLEDVAFVELGVADQRDHPTGWLTGRDQPL